MLWLASSSLSIITLSFQWEAQKILSGIHRKSVQECVHDIIAGSFAVRQSKTILPFFEIALVFVRFDDVTSSIVNADHSGLRPHPTHHSGIWMIVSCVHKVEDSGLIDSLINNEADLDTSADKDGAAVCLLDDDLSVLKATSRLLRSSGWQAKSFSDPLAFLRHVQAYSPPVAVIDVSMPRMNGLEVQRRLCRLSPATRVIFFTGKDDPVVRSQALAAGASAFFLKSESTEEFLAGIQAAIPS